MTELPAGVPRRPDTLLYVFGLTAALEDKMVAQFPLLPVWHLSAASASPASHFLGHECGIDL